MLGRSSAFFYKPFRFRFHVNILSAKHSRDETGLKDVEHESDREHSPKAQVDEKKNKIIHKNTKKNKHLLAIIVEKYTLQRILIKMMDLVFCHG